MKEKTCVVNLVGLIRGRIALNILKSLSPNLTIANLVLTTRFDGHDVNHCFTLHLKLKHGQINKCQYKLGFYERPKKGKYGQQIWSTIELICGESNTKEARFIGLETLITKIIAHVKSRLGKVKDWDVDPIYFCGVDFFELVTFNKHMLDVSKCHDDGKHIGVLNSIKMFSIIALMTRINGLMLKCKNHKLLMKGYFNVMRFNAKCHSHGHLCQ